MIRVPLPVTLRCQSALLAQFKNKDSLRNRKAKTVKVKAPQIARHWISLACLNFPFGLIRPNASEHVKSLHLTQPNLATGMAATGRGRPPPIGQAATAQP